MSLSIDQWAICIVVALSLIVVEEARKLLKIRTVDDGDASAAVASCQPPPDPRMDRVARHLGARSILPSGGQASGR